MAAPYPERAPDRRAAGPRRGARGRRPGRGARPPPARRRSGLVADAVGDARLQGPDLDEARGGLLGEEAAGLGERRELRVVDGVRGHAGHDAGAALEELDADRARDALVDVADVGLDVGAQGLPPEAAVDQVGPLAVELGLELVLVDRA